MFSPSHSRMELDDVICAVPTIARSALRAAPVPRQSDGSRLRLAMRSVSAFLIEQLRADAVRPAHQRAGPAFRCGTIHSATLVVAHEIEW
jgi:hypothetical protein